MARAPRARSSWLPGWPSCLCQCPLPLGSPRHRAGCQSGDQGERLGRGHSISEGSGVPLTFGKWGYPSPKGRLSGARPGFCPLSGSHGAQGSLAQCSRLLGFAWGGWEKWTVSRISPLGDGRRSSSGENLIALCLVKMRFWAGCGAKELAGILLFHLLDFFFFCSA